MPLYNYWGKLFVKNYLILDKVRYGEESRAPGPSLSYITLSLLLYLPTFLRFSTFPFPNYPTFPILFPLPSTLTSLPYLPLPFRSSLIPIFLFPYQLSPFPLNLTLPCFSSSLSLSLTIRFPSYPLPCLPFPQTHPSFSSVVTLPLFLFFFIPFSFLSHVFLFSFISLFLPLPFPFFPSSSFPLLLGLWFPIWLFTLLGF